ncbi:MAG TPA: N-acetylmuramoyl-L-alanine amidase [Saprospiraceae bacterium]|nr:N-acetylmuramoyl-L-alanine amidase [Saprospiraceae bacterium]
MKSILWALLLLLFVSPLAAKEDNWVTYKAEKGDGIIVMLTKFNLYGYQCNEKKFYQLNHLKPNAHLIINKQYKLPILKYKYNGKSIRSTIKKNDWEKAIRIKTFNEMLFDSGLRKTSFLKDMELWVPYHELKCPNEKPKLVREKNIFPIFGPKYQNVKTISQVLKGKVFYIMGGHGGPDPGAIGKRGNHKLCEDEYGYDVALRLARKLIAHGAVAHVILRDPNDGIRDEKFLKCDSDEVYLGKKKVLRAQIPRLEQRANIVNDLFLTYKKRGVANRNQIAIMLHIDSRNTRSRTDVFFYHAPNATESEKIANQLYRTFKAKYKKFQASKSYEGSVSARDLYMLMNLKPRAVYLELANIRNKTDQKRLILSENRDALAKWIMDGLIAYYR